MISVRNLKKSFANVPVLRDINAEIQKGDVISIIGPSGTGKSTFLRCLNLLETPDGGEIFVDGENMLAKGADVRYLRRRMGMVFQSFNLFSHLMIIENLMLGPMQLLGMDRQQAYNEAMARLGSVGIADKAYAYPDEMSGGQKQRAAIARTLAMHPEIVLFDEPTSALDPTMVSEVLAVLRKLAAEGLTMMIVTHEMGFARDVSSRVFYMDEGLIYEDGSPEQIFEAPRREKTRAFIQKIKSFIYHIDSRKFDFYNMNSQIEGFATRHMIGGIRLRNMLSVAEEMIMHLLLPRLRGNIDIDLVIEYSEQTGDVQMTVMYAGQDMQILADDTDLSVMLIKKFAHSIDAVQLDDCHAIRMQM